VKLRNLETQLQNTCPRKLCVPFRRRGCMWWRERILVSCSQLYCFNCPYSLSFRASQRRRKSSVKSRIYWPVICHPQRRSSVKSTNTLNKNAIKCDQTRVVFISLYVFIALLLCKQYH